jgi:hypothetical protein
VTKRLLFMILLGALTAAGILVQAYSNPAAYSGELDGTGPIAENGLPVVDTCDDVYWFAGAPEYPNEVEEKTFYVTEDGTYNFVITAPGPDDYPPDGSIDPYAMLYEGSFNVLDTTENCLWAKNAVNRFLSADLNLNANTTYILVVSHQGRPVLPDTIKEGPYNVNISTTGSGEICLGELGACDPPPPDENGNGSNNTVERLHVPNRGMIQISTWQAQPLYNTPGGQVVRDGNHHEIWLPNDADDSGADTYVITEVRLHNGTLWLGIFMGSGIWGWVPADNVTPLTFIPGYDDYMAALMASASGEE